MNLAKREEILKEQVNQGETDEMTRKKPWEQAESMGAELSSGATDAAQVEDSLAVEVRQILKPLSKERARWFRELK